MPEVASPAHPVTTLCYFELWGCQEIQRDSWWYQRHWEVEMYPHLIRLKTINFDLLLIKYIWGHVKKGFSTHSLTQKKNGPFRLIALIGWPSKKAVAVFSIEFLIWSYCCLRFLSRLIGAWESLQNLTAQSWALLRCEIFLWNTEYSLTCVTSE